jgi:hypothetical protein
MADANRPDYLDRTDSRREHCQRLHAALKNERSSWESHWRECGDFVKPRRLQFTGTDVNRGDRRSQKIIDSTATFALRTLAAGMMSGLSSPARPWFRLTTPDPDLAEQGSVKQWLHVVTQRMQTVFLRSNLYNVLPTIYSDMGLFGTAAMAVLEDDESVMRCHPFPIGSYCLGNDAKQRVRVFTREPRFTVRQIVELFAPITGRGLRDWSRVSQRVRDAWKAGRTEDWVDVTHVIEPNPEADPGRLFSRYKPFRSTYYEQGGDPDVALEDKGFDEFPILAPRWEVSAGDVYGSDCPGMTVLGDIRQLQAMKRRMLQGIEKMVNPPMVGPPQLRSVKASTIAGDITYVQESQHQSFRPAHEVRLNLADLRNEVAATQYMIRRGFYEDLFLMLDQALDGDPRKTATEIMERKEEKILALGPVLEQTNQDLHDPLIDRCFAIMDRRHLIPPPPPELEGQALKVDYESIMAQALKSTGRSSVDTFTGFALNLAKFKPDALDKVDTDQLLDEYGQITAVPPRIVRSDEDVQAIRQQRAQAEQAAHQAEVAKNAAAAAQSLGNTPTDGPNALTDLAGAMGGGAQPGGMLQ